MDQLTKPQTEQPEEDKTIIGPAGEPIKVTKGLSLAYEKFTQGGGKHYRLIWVQDQKAWLCEEDPTRYKRVHSDDKTMGVVEAGKALLDRLELPVNLGVKFEEPGSTDKTKMPAVDNRRARLARRAILRGHLKRIKRAARQAKAEVAAQGDQSPEDIALAERMRPVQAEAAAG